MVALLALFLSEVGGGNGAERRPPPGNQAQRPLPSHRTHDTTDQWRDFISVARAKVGGHSFSFLSSRIFAPSCEWLKSHKMFILLRNYNGFAQASVAE